MFKPHPSPLLPKERVLRLNPDDKMLQNKLKLRKDFQQYLEMKISKDLYQKDFQLWLKNTIEQLENRDFTSLDVEHLIEELYDLGKSERNALISNLIILLAHLLKIQVQDNVPEMMKGSWYDSINEHRARILFQLEETPSLKAQFQEAIVKAYPKARKLAIKDSKNASKGIRIPPETEYPHDCPFTTEEIFNEDFFHH
jgi:Domain of unknown function DUF29